MIEKLVSIIVPLYNSEKFIKQTIDTVKEQTYSNWELIIVNDCSTDGSKKIIENYKEEKRIKLIELKENSGAAIARNVGIEHAKGEYIAFLDADDLWEKEKLEKQIKFMEENEYEFTFTGYEFGNENAYRTGKIVRVPEKISYTEAIKNTTIFTSTVMVNVKKLGKELIKMPNVGSEDSATWWKILKTGVIAYGINENLSLYRRSSNTLSSNKIKALKKTWNLYRNVEKFSILKSCYCFSFYSLNAIKRRL